MPGSLPTMARREPTRRLKSEDLPTLGRPTMARRGGASGLKTLFAELDLRAVSVIFRLLEPASPREPDPRRGKIRAGRTDEGVCAYVIGTSVPLLPPSYYRDSRAPSLPARDLRKFESPRPGTLPLQL